MGGPCLTWNPSPVSRPMSFVSPTTNSAMTSAKPMKPGALHDRERDRAAAHLLGERPEDVAAVERQEREEVDHAERERDHREQEDRPVGGEQIDWRVAS